jgi:isopropylmalate/homocitrate/citramalate synthase
MLDHAGVDVLDAGFPAASGSDLEAMQQMRGDGLSCRIAATARPLRGDIRAAAASHADEVFLFMPTSELRLKETLGISREQAGRLFCEGAEEAASHGLAINLVYEDASRAAPALMGAIARDVAARVPLRRAILADTVGCSWPRTMEALVSDVRAQIPDDVVICTHCHNDFGLAGANTLAAVSAGAAAVTCTVNGLGERAGNADLAETAAALTHLLGVQHHIDPLALRPLAQQVERLSGVHCSPTKPVTGFNVYRHESGVHVDGMLKDRRSYEFLPSAWAGGETEYVLGKHSGRALVRHLLRELGLSLTEEEEAQLLRDVKQRAESRDKSSHARAWLMKEAFHAVCLSGIDPVLLLSAYLERRRKQPPAALDALSRIRLEP